MHLTHPSRHTRGRQFVQQLLSPAGIDVDGNRPFDLRILDDAFYDQALPHGIDGVLDAYVAGWWESDRLDELTARVISGGLRIPFANTAALWLSNVSGRIVNHQSRRRSMQVRRHYDLGNDLFKAMLDRRMVYSCAYWKDVANLDAAQEAKLELIARKVGLKPGMRVLDIGCGWGSFAKYAAETHGASVVGITIAKEQYELGQTLCAHLPVQLHCGDYRELHEEPFDAVISLGMFEHVGYKNYRTFMKHVRRHLKPNGLFCLQTIGRNTSGFSVLPWINRNIFPNGMLPSAQQITAAAEGLFVLEDWHSFGPDYDKTLMAWFANFQDHWPELADKYGKHFYRMWKCYLLTCAGAFRARDNELWQIVFSPTGVKGGYVSCR